MTRLFLPLILAFIGCTASAKRERFDSPEAAYKKNDFARCGALYAARGDRYNAACCYARAGATDLAVDQLEDAEAVDLAGFDQDEDLASLKVTPRWSQLLAKVAEARAKMNQELLALVTEDQSDRTSVENSAANGKAIVKRDEARRLRVSAILAAGGAKTSADFYNAALVFQHGQSRDEYARAHELALKAVELDGGSKKARWLTAASEDRLLMHEGKPQKYGTQYSRGEDGHMRLWKVDPSVTDAQRAEWNVPTLAQAKERETKPDAP